MPLFTPVEPPRIEEDCKPWLHEAIKRLNRFALTANQNFAAVIRGESPDGSGNPILDLSKYLYKPGLSGGQNTYLGLNASEGGFFSSTFSQTKGFIYLGSARQTAYDEVNERIGINTPVPTAKLHISTAFPAQSIRANADNNDGNGWANSNGNLVDMYSYIDEVTPDDSDYVRFTTGGGNNPLTLNMSTATDPGAGGTAVISVRASTNIALGVNARVRVQISSFFQKDYGQTGATRDFTLTSTPTTFQYTLTAGEYTTLRSVIGSQPWALSLSYSGVGGSVGVIDVQWVELLLTGVSGSDSIVKVTVGSNTDTLAASGTDLQLTGPMPLFAALGSAAASGLRIAADATSQHLEAGSAAGANKIMVIGGYSASALTSLRIAGPTSISDTSAPGAPGGLLDLLTTTDQKVLKLRPNSTQTNDILQVRNNADSSTLAAIDSTGKGVFNIGLQLNAQTPAAGKIATSSDSVGNFTWSTASVISSTWAYTARTTTYSILTTDGVIDCTSGTFTVTLPTAVGVAGKMYVIKNSGTGIITIATTSSQTIDGATTATLAYQFEAIAVVSDGANWKIF